MSPKESTSGDQASASAPLHETPEQFKYRLQSGAYERLNLCPDHRGKTGDYCIVCRAETRTREELRDELAARLAHQEAAMAGIRQSLETVMIEELEAFARANAADARLSQLSAKIQRLADQWGDDGAHGSELLAVLASSPASQRREP